MGGRASHPHVPKRAPTPTPPAGKRGKKAPAVKETNKRVPHHNRAQKEHRKVNGTNFGCSEVEDQLSSNWGKGKRRGLGSHSSLPKPAGTLHFYTNPWAGVSEKGAQRQVPD